MSVSQPPRQHHTPSPPFSKLGLDAVNPKDGSTVEAINLISPMMSFFALIVAFVQR